MVHEKKEKGVLETSPMTDIERQVQNNMIDGARTKTQTSVTNPFMTSKITKTANVLIQYMVEQQNS